MPLSKKEEQELLLLIKQEEDHWKYNKFQIYYAEHGYQNSYGDLVHSRYAYPKHVSFFDAGKDYPLRAFIAGNQTGKSLAGCYEDICHATGIYPSWWKGYRFTRPVTIWLCGDRGEAIRDSLQKKLLGDVEQGTGLIPKDLLIKTSQMPGIPGGVGQYHIKHVSGGVSTIAVRTYQSGRTAFEAATVDVIHLDEECPRDIFSECCTRTTQTKGILYLTFTPDSGLTDTVSFFLDKNDGVQKYVCTVGWDDVPHISEERKKLLLSTYSVHERDCRSKGTPYLGRGKIYGMSEDSYVIDPLKFIPRHWPRVFGMDVGYAHPTACLWMAWDRESDIVYAYSEYKEAQAMPSSHANAILARGKWIPGVIDTSARNTSPTDGQRLITLYDKFGLDLVFVKKGAGSVEEGILEVSDRLESGRLKFYETLTKTIDEIRLYRRDDNGQIVKKDDDLMDALRYGLRSGLYCAAIEPNEDQHNFSQRNVTGRSLVGGY